MKKEILKSIKFIAIVAVLAVGISYLGFESSEKSSAAVYTGPCSSPTTPGQTICEPLTESPISDVKNGGLSVGAFVAQGDSVIVGPVYIDDNLTVSSGTDLTTGKVKIESLAGTGVRPICASCSGKLFVCGTPPAAETCSVTGGTTGGSN